MSTTSVVQVNCRTVSLATPSYCPLYWQATGWNLPRDAQIKCELQLVVSIPILLRSFMHYTALVPFHLRVPTHCVCGVSAQRWRGTSILYVVHTCCHLKVYWWFDILHVVCCMCAIMDHVWATHKYSVLSAAATP